MSNWNYQRESGSNVTAGDHRFEVIGVEDAISKSSGKPMIVIEVKPNGASFTVKKFVVEGDYFNRTMTSFFDSTGIEEGNFNFITWVGAMGAARFKEDDKGYLELAYFIDQKRAEKLPPWVGDMPERQTVTNIGGDDEGFAVDDEESPF